MWYNINNVGQPEPWINYAKDVIFLSEKEIKAAINNAEISLNIEGLSVSEQTKFLCEKLLTKQITMAEYISIVKQKAGITA